MQSHKDLNVWKMSIDFAEDVYTITKQYPKEEMYGMVSQMRRAATSIPMNIAEGYARSTDKENIHFLYIAAGSAAEVDTQLILSERLGYIDEETSSTMQGQVTSIRKMLSSLIASIKKRNANL